MLNLKIEENHILFLNTQQKMDQKKLLEKMEELKKLKFKKNKSTQDRTKIHQLEGGAGRNSEIDALKKNINGLIIEKNKLKKHRINVQKNEIKKNTHQIILRL